MLTRVGCYGTPQFEIRNCHGSFPVFSFQIHANDVMPIAEAETAKDAGGEEF